MQAAPGAIGNAATPLVSLSPTSAPTVYSPCACSLRTRPERGPRVRPLRIVRRLPIRPVPLRGNLDARQACDNPEHNRPFATVSFLR